MSCFLDNALAHIARGWYVFPLKPNGKFPLISKADGGNGFYDATLDPEQVKAWWAKYPTANVGIACGASNLYVVDCDHGLETYEEFLAWRERNGIPVTYTVRTGRRTSYAVQMVFQGAIASNGKWELDGCSGEIRSTGGLVMSVGNIHPDTGEIYELLIDAPLAPRAAIFEQAVRHAKAERPSSPGEPLPMLGKGDGRHPLMMTKLGKAHAAGFSEQEAIGLLVALNDERFSDAIPLEEIEQTVESCYAKWSPAAALPVVTIGGKQTPETAAEPKDWREHYHTFDEMNNAPKPTFLIDGFLQKDVITAIAAPVGQRKTIVACNAVHAILTGEPLFGHFAVTERPTRVLYLCPEMGLLSFADRMRNLGLLPYVGKTLFCRTMNSEGHLTLTDLTAEELAGAVVVIDTAVRFVIGDENSSEDMKVFAETCFGLMKGGASSVVVLFHSPKGTKEASELTLENAMRGSGDLGAFVSSCWATRLQDPDNDEWKSPSYMKNVKQRDFKSKPFEVTSDERGKLHIVAPPNANVTLTGKKTGTPGNMDGREDEALQIIQDNPDLSQAKIMLKLSTLGIKRSKSWIGNKRFELLNVGVKVAELTTAP